MRDPSDHVCCEITCWKSLAMLTLYFFSFGFFQKLVQQVRELENFDVSHCNVSVQDYAELFFVHKMFI